ncbi:NTP transferase domain-containing protein [Pseudoroseomonas sp. WGS1072]|uniref:NTP transferase domain-containing protein n=1 Tax=Roseomonas sp. WGS1072 TaxID=3366816 RepID=UPI003BF1BA14
MSSVTAIIMAGSRAGAADPMAVAGGVSHKALLPVGGVPMLSRVVRALQASPGIGRIVVMIEAPARSLAGYDAPPGLLLREAAGSPSRSVAAALAEFNTPLLVTTADHALLTPAMVAHFMAAVPAGTDVAAGLARAETVLAAWPGTRRTWLRFRDGRFSGCNLFWIGGPGAAAVVQFWQRVEQNRKAPLAMVALLGPLALLRFSLGRLRLDAALRLLGQRAGGARLAVVELPFAEAAVDVDKPDDLALAEAALAGRAGG